MTSKRKWTDIDDSDEDEPSFGRQILPVADLPDDFHDTPVDGLQYLFTVRRDARQLPQVTRVENPYETTHSPPPHTTPKLDCSHLLPSAEWRSLFEIRCKNLRLNMAQPTIYIQFTPKTDPIRLMPDKKDRDLWWAFLSGKPESEWNPPKQPKQPKRRSFMRGFADDPYQYEEGKPSDGVDLYANQEENMTGGTQSLPTPSGTPAPSDASDQLASLNAPNNPVANSLQPREPTMSLLQHIDERAAFHLLMYFTHWINIYVSGDTTFQPIETHARWIFFLLSRIDEYISPDEINALRNLARACLALLKSLIQRRLSKAKTDPDVETGLVLNYMGERSCWIIISTIVGIWGQRDLLMDAEEALKELS